MESDLVISMLNLSSFHTMLLAQVPVHVALWSAPVALQDFVVIHEKAAAAVQALLVGSSALWALHLALVLLVTFPCSDRGPEHLFKVGQLSLLK